MRFGVLGPIMIWAADETPRSVLGAKVRALLAVLLLHRGRPVSVERLIDDLWGERLPGNPSGALQAKVSQLRRALEEIEPGGRDLLVHQPPGYLLRVEPDAVDAGQFATLTARARETDDPRTRATLLSEALALWRGPAFDEFTTEPFAAAASSRLTEEWLDAVEAQAEARLTLGEHSLLAGELGEMVTRYPPRERLRSVHMRALYRSGRQREALDSYEDLRVHLAEQLGLDPSPELAALHQAILRQDDELDPEPGSAAGSTRPRSNLPAALTELIGRDAAVGEVHTRLADSRLVTLTGPGGVGKTRLAVHVAGQLVDSCPDGVWLVELAAHGRSFGPEGTEALAEAVLGVLGIREDSPAGVPPGTQLTSSLDRLAEALRDKQLLLVLDNCERVVDPVAGMAETLLAAAPGLSILATSQEPLALAGEAVWPVPPLEVPTEAELRPGGLAMVELLRCDAVRLFVARAAAALPGFSLTEENAAPIGMICRRLDGIPLALELAATKVRGLGVTDILSRLDDRFRLLGNGQRGVPARQQTLRATIDWSWELLTGTERALLRRLAIHVDGCTLDAAEAVSAAADLDPADVPYLITRLVDRSLVTTVDDTSGGRRYRMLESVVDYAIERLHEAGEFDQVRQAHQRYYVELAVRAEPHLRGHDQQRWLQRLDLETPNLRMALEGALADRRDELAIRLVAALGWYWVLRGRLTEASHSLADALSGVEGLSAEIGKALTWQAGVSALMGEEADLATLNQTVLDSYAKIADPAGRAHAEWFLAFAMHGRTDQSILEDLLESALDGFRVVCDRWGTAAALSTRATQAAGRGELDVVSRDGQQSLSLFRELGDRWGLLQANDVLGWLAEVNGEYEKATALHFDGLRIAEDLGLWLDVSLKLSRLGRISMLSADYQRAEEFHERARKLAADQSSKPAQHFAELGLGLGARRRGKLDEAEGWLSRWIDWCRTMAWGPGIALILAELGFVAEQRGDTQAALALQREGFDVARETGDDRAVALAWEGLAGAQASAGEYRQAARLLGAAAMTRDLVGAPLPSAERGDVERISAVVRQELGEQTFLDEFAAGREMGGADPRPADFGV